MSDLIWVTWLPTSPFGFGFSLGKNEMSEKIIVCLFSYACRSLELETWNIGNSDMALPQRTLWQEAASPQMRPQSWDDIDCFNSQRPTSWTESAEPHVFDLVIRYHLLPRLPRGANSLVERQLCIQKVLGPILGISNKETAGRWGRLQPQILESCYPNGPMTWLSIRNCHVV